MSKKRTVQELYSSLCKDDENIEQELINSGSDRACVIVGAAVLDDLLEMLFHVYFSNSPSKNDENPFVNNGALSTFSSKINLSYLLGLISSDEHRKLTYIRKIRNEFAHGACVHTFQGNRNVENWIKEIIISDKLGYIHKVGKTGQALTHIVQSNPLRSEFIICVVWLENMIRCRIMTAWHKKNQPAKSYTNAVEPIDTFIAVIKLDIEKLRQSGEHEKIQQEEAKIIELQKTKFAILEAMKKAGLLDDEEYYKARDSRF